MNTTIDITGAEPINITPMSREEARECITAIKGNLESLRLMLLELHRRKGWEALGYSSWEDCAIVEFGKSRSYVFQLLTAAQVEVNLTSNAKSTIVDLEDIPVSQLTALAKLPPEQQAEGLLLAEEIAQTEGKKRNAIHVAQAVREIKPSRLSRKRAKTKASPTRNLDKVGQPLNSTDPLCADRLSIEGCPTLSKPFPPSANLASLQKNIQSDEQQSADVDAVDDAPDMPASSDQSEEGLLGKEVKTDRDHTLDSISADIEQNCINFLNSIESLNHKHIAATVSALAATAHMNPKKLVPLSDTELESFIGQLNLLTQTAETLLSKRHSLVA